eukprot:TRINITY_DN10476_c0_g1_i1.p1 TRINITY_DN10476_c0_g1~~TRINITY_DN10476_c0_g1_i1.p1  ORF type:complete len:181 (+),score=27.70 TRINITY_DN10476_c0_g1_i1:107-649(+)
MYQFLEAQVLFIIVGLAFFALFSMPLRKGWKQKLILFVQTNQVIKYIFSFGSFCVLFFVFYAFMNYKEGENFSHMLKEYNREHIGVRDLFSYEISMKMFNSQRYTYIYTGAIIIYLALLMLIYIQKQFYLTRDEVQNLKKYNEKDPALNSGTKVPNNQFKKEQSDELLAQQKDTKEKKQQ